MKKILEKLKNSPINYFSDLFVCAMVICWIAVIVIMIAVGIYSTTRLDDTSIWAYTADLVSTPIAAGCGIWMVKNTVQHAIMNNKGKQCPADFPAVNGNDEIDGQEQEIGAEEELEEGSDEESEEFG